MASLPDVGRGFDIVADPQFWFEAFLAGFAFTGSDAVESFARENLVDLDFQLSSIAYDVGAAAAVLAVLPRKLSRPLAVGLVANASNDLARNMGLTL